MSLGLLGIPEVPPETHGALICGTCGKAWVKDITPAGRCPWEYDHPSVDPPARTVTFTQEELDDIANALRAAAVAYQSFSGDDEIAALQECRDLLADIAGLSEEGEPMAHTPNRG